jgi:putative hydrolase of the HAD superfamily
MRYEGIQRVLADHGVSLATEDLKRGYEQSASRLQAVWNENNEVTMKDQVRLIVELAAGRSVALEAPWLCSLEGAYVDPILWLPPKLNRDVPGVLEVVRDRGYKVGLICNTGRSPGGALRKLLDTFDVLKFFDATVFSNEVMRRKPDQSIFDNTAQALGVDKERIVHVGDNPESDYWGAKNAGMHAILLDQPSPDAARWGPNSLFTLTRSNLRRSAVDVEARWRVASLNETPSRIDSVFDS